MGCCCLLEGSRSSMLTSSRASGMMGAQPLGLLRASLEYALRRDDTRDAVRNMLSSIDLRRLNSPFGRGLG